MKYPLMIPDINNDDIKAVELVLRSGMLTQGPHVKLLEDKISSITGVHQSIAVSNGTASLHLALLALGIGSGDEVIVPSFSYVATANVVELVGAIPIFVDIEITTFNINTELIESAITKRTKAIIPVHEFGLAADISRIMDIAKKHNLYVIEDAACALGAKDNNVYVGSFGNLGSFSFHPRKNITSGEGGVITTNSEEISTKCKSLRNHGIDPNNSNFMDFTEAGLNYRLTDFQASLLNSQLKRFKHTLEVRDSLAQIYLTELDNRYIQLPSIPKGKNHTWQTFHIVLDNSINRRILIENLRNKGIGANYGAQCIPEVAFYKKKYNLDSRRLFPNAFNAFNNGLALPLYSLLSSRDISIISEEVNKSIKDVRK